MRQYVYQPLEMKSCTFGTSFPALITPHPHGSSGCGVLHNPALGKLLSEIMLDGRASSLGVEMLRPERFLEGQPIIGNSLL